MQHFLAQRIEGDRALLDSGESHHLHRVLRMEAGERVCVTDGEGTVWKSTILESHAKASVLKLEDIWRVEQAAKLHLALGPPKSNDRYHMVLEKATEWGVASITPVRCFHSERKVVKDERDARVIRAAVKQSKKGLLPRLNPMRNLKDFLRDSWDQRACYMAHLEEGPRRSLRQVDWQRETWVLLGPEGDFAPGEVQQAQEAGWKGLSLGPEVLRTETAALTVAAAAYLDRL